MQWNGFAEDQRERIWERLRDLRTGAVTSIIRIIDAEKLLGTAIAADVPNADQLPPPMLAWEVLRRMQGLGLKLGAVGLATISGDDGGLCSQDSVKIFRQIEGELYQRSLAHYEHNFKTPVQ